MIKIRIISYYLFGNVNDTEIPTELAETDLFNSSVYLMEV